MQINDDTSRALEQVRIYAGDLDQFEARIKTCKEIVADMVEAMPESSDITELQEKLNDKKAQLKSRLMGKAEYNDAMTNLGEEQDSMKSAKQHLSDALVMYFSLTGESQVEVSDSVARELLISAKLGKEQLYQHSLFAKGEN
jgi:hypothetical protein